MWFQREERLKALEKTVRRFQRSSRKSARNPLAEAEVTDMNAGAVDSNLEQSAQNMVDVAGFKPTEGKYDESDLPDYGQTNMLDVSEFFERFVHIASFAVSPGNPINYSVSLLETLLNEPSIRAKVKNFSFISCDMEVNISVTGSPFHYGQVFASYQPLAGVNAPLAILEGYAATTQRGAFLTYLSQSKMYADTQLGDNSPMVLQIPFISPQPMLRLFNQSPLILTELQSFDDTNGFGNLYIQSYNDVACASPTPSDISITVKARLLNVKLGAPTGTVFEVGTESDEREVGPVERIATRATEIANALTQVPFIAPFAKASSMVSSSIGYIASLFGYSVPTIITAPEYVKNNPYMNSATTIGYDTGFRITLDPKQELTIDPRALALTEDEMAISTLCQIPSYLDTFAWAASDAALSTSIYMMPITPRVAQRYLLSGSTYVVQPTALNFAATPFDYWNGSITVKVVVASSKYHRGKLCVYYEPNISQNVVIDAELNLNKQYMIIVDIQETQEVTFTVNWAFPKAWALNMPNSLIEDLGGVGYLGDAYFPYANGYIAVTPFTALQSPDDSDVEVNVFIWSDDIRFNRLTSAHMPVLRPVAESDMEYVVDINESSADLRSANEWHFGEVPVSFRGLLKRFASPLAAHSPLFAGTFDEVLHPIYPEIWPRFDGAAINTPTLYGYLRYGYVGFRGGMKHRLDFAGSIALGDMNAVRVSLYPPADVAVSPVWVATASDVVDRYRMDGTIGYVPTTNGGIEFELPFYSSNLFAISFSDDPFPSTLTSIEPRNTLSFATTFASSAVDSGALVLDSIAAAEDFSFMRFQGGAPFTITV
jgi:hypothetical protein